MSPLRPVTRIFALCTLIFASITACGQNDAFEVVTAQQAKASYDAKAAVFLDVRSTEEWNAGHLHDALHLPVDRVAAGAAQMLPDKGQALVVYCRSGRRAAVAAKTLDSMGYNDIKVIRGGYGDIRAADYPVVAPK